MDDQNRDDSQPQEHAINFALLIQQTTTAQGTQYKLEARNQGIPEPEVILLVESWLDAVKNKFKEKIKEGLFPPDKDPSDGE